MRNPFSRTPGKSAMRLHLLIVSVLLIQDPITGPALLSNFEGVHPAVRRGDDVQATRFEEPDPVEALVRGAQGIGHYLANLPEGYGAAVVVAQRLCRLECIGDKLE